MRRRSARAFFAAGLLSTVMAITPDAHGAGLSDTLSQLDTGPFKDATCQSGIQALVGAVQGLGGSEFTNVKVEDDVISGNLSLPIGGTWDLHLFAPDCSGKLFGLFTPGQDIKISDVASSVPGLAELDKLGLSNQAFILSNTETTLAASEAPDTVKTELTNAANGDGDVSIEVKSGLTVLGVMDLSRSTLTKKAMEFLGFSDSSMKMAIDGFLGAGGQ